MSIIEFLKETVITVSFQNLGVKQSVEAYVLNGNESIPTGLKSILGGEKHSTLSLYRAQIRITACKHARKSEKNVNF